ncbi:hypothetical protein AMTR_s00012p00222300 [Amborella trichopoda]|uniref:NB-ARC domain-containing protein n=1 Tax=Amborella trichopoda TaxID=13333 RepID=W1PJN4_AMBTC|nr:hypothetical protein AMTR_s00012p00222300 [Amborella trichopoda]
MISDDFEELSSLKTLDLSKTNLRSLPRSIRGLSQLESLTINYCKHLVVIPELPNSMKLLDASGCKHLQTLPKLSHIYKLAKLLICECEHLIAIPDLPTSLEYLDPWECRSLPTMPKLSHLFKLQRLIEIQSLSGLKSLRALHLNGCSPRILHLIQRGPHQTICVFDSPAARSNPIYDAFELQWLIQTRGQKQLSLEASGKYLQKILGKQQMFSDTFNTSKASDELVPHASVTGTSTQPFVKDLPKKEKVGVELWDNDSNTSKTSHGGSLANEEEEHQQHVVAKI